MKILLSIFTLELKLLIYNEKGKDKRYGIRYKKWEILLVINYISVIQQMINKQ